ncbi:hypothetical protein PoB_007293700 [Plakobranchus ocellatus]|uniref:Uncharacterized protein n=1 Tax=Plakobranchus ocellatus TaxID=259542 RepID=A0AAV4DQQ7_9GAST|nr:hypothetical protein PoB_007293700 [Plakobranchus ocellatus]
MVQNNICHENEMVSKQMDRQIPQRKKLMLHESQVYLLENNLRIWGLFWDQAQSGQVVEASDVGPVAFSVSCTGHPTGHGAVMIRRGEGKGRRWARWMRQSILNWEI